jgi:ABC-type multidrug transport system fused ATPase/permease subunit
LAEEDDPGEIAGGPPLQVPHGAVEFRDVHFGYLDDTPVLCGVTLKIRPGEWLGITGASGSGKSTLINLLLRFHEPTQGAILIDGQPIRAHSPESLRAAMAIVEQNERIFNASVRENLAMGLPGHSTAEIEAALGAACADDIVAELEDPEDRTGLSAHLGEEGAYVSGGQRQRLALARALLRRRRLILLDEATSALDLSTEQAVFDALKSASGGATVVAVAHRPETLRRMDRLVVLRAGRIVADGPPDAVLPLHAASLARTG